MKNKKRLQRVSVLVVAMLSLATFSLIGTGASCPGGTGNYLVSENSRAANGGGTLKSYVERQRDSASSVSGNARTVTYRVYADYSPDASQTTEWIRTEWTVRATFSRPISGSFSAGLTVGADELGVEVGASSSSQWQDLAITKYWQNGKATTHSFYGPSEYVLFPNTQLYSHAVSNVARVKLANSSTPTELTVTA